MTSHDRARYRPRSVSSSRSWLVAACVVAVAVLPGCAAADPAAAPAEKTAVRAAASAQPAPEPSSVPSTEASEPETLDPADGYALTPTGDEVLVHDSPDGAVVHELDAVRETGAPLTLLLEEDPGDGWYEVLLPLRPNGSTGWVSADDVSVQRVTHRLEMSVDTNELRVFEDGRLLRTMPAASGTGDTPTPLGSFYLTELLEPTNSGYGPYAYGMSGFSEVLTSFGGGPGQIGLHGTDDAASVGRAVSRGCIRLSDEDITYLAELLPLGTPVDVVETSAFVEG